MQINRLFEIVYILLERDRVTAHELADRFEVSTKTIYRDVETLSGAGIPVYMVKGQGGGIRLMDEFVLNKVLLTDREKREVLASLQGMLAAEALSERDTLEKLQHLFGYRDHSWVEIDFGDWGSIFREQFQTVKKAILERRILQFDYIAANGERTQRHVEPMQLWFKDHIWYMRCYCLDRQAQRLFRLSRMRNVHCTEQRFVMRVPEFVQESETFAEAGTVIRMRIAEPQIYRVYDEFREEDVRLNDDGSYEVTMRMIVDEWAYGYILSFGAAAEVLSPDWVRREIRRRLLQCMEKY